jgi:hypothetical protein
MMAVTAMAAFGKPGAPPAIVPLLLFAHRLAREDGECVSAGLDTRRGGGSRMRP